MVPVLTALLICHEARSGILEYTLDRAATYAFIKKVEECPLDPYDQPLAYKESARQWLLEAMPPGFVEIVKELDTSGENVLLIHNFPVDAYVPATPRNGARPPKVEHDASGHLIENQMAKGFVSEAALLGLCGLLDCDPDYDEREKDGVFINQIIPVNAEKYRGQESSFGSDLAFSWHTENIYQMRPLRFFSLLCLRSDPKVATGVLFVDDILEAARSRYPKQFDHLMEQMRLPQFVMATGGSFENARVEAVLPILAQDDRGQMVFRLNLSPGRMRGVSSQGDEVIRMLSDTILSEEFAREHTHRIVLQNGDCLLLNNWKSMHSRDAFKIDPLNWRWLQRMYFKRSAI